MHFITQAVVSHFETPSEAARWLGAVGLNAIPLWCQPHHALSTGEAFRASLARQAENRPPLFPTTPPILTLPTNSPYERTQAKTQHQKKQFEPHP